MALTKSKKQQVLGDLADIIKKAKTLVFVKFDKLSVFNSNALRRELRSNESGLRVAKKRLLLKSLNEAGFTGNVPELEGEVMLAYSTDELAPAQKVYEFQKTHKDNISIVGGVFDGAYMNQIEMMSIATIPSIEGLRGMFVNVINSPIQRFAIALNEVAKKQN
jgi:large subunit ribosomal protein L10